MDIIFLLLFSSTASASYLNVTSIIGRNAEIPCELTPKSKTDNAYLVLWWFHDIFGTPIYSFDMRNNTKHWMASDLGEQASFYVNRTGKVTSTGVEIVQSYLQIKSVQWKDQGFYRCRVDFFQAPTRNLKVKLSLIELPKVPKITQNGGQPISSEMPSFHLNSTLNLKCETSGGIPEPTLNWWLYDSSRNEKVFVRKDSGSVSALKYGPLMRHHHNNRMICEAQNNEQVAPEAEIQIQMIMPPTRIQFKRLHSNFVTEKTYNITCTTYGSNPQAYTRIWHENQELEILESKAISSLESVITAKFQPLPEDHGTFLICKAENPLIANSAVEDHWKIDVKYGPKCSYKGPQRIYAGIGEKILLLCDMTPYPDEQKPLTFEWEFQGQNSADPNIIRTLSESASSEDKFQYDVRNRRAFGQIICTARSILQTDVKGTEKPCFFEIVPKDVPYLEGCSVIHLKEKWITVECLLNQEETLSGDKKEGDELEYWVTILNADGEKFMQTFTTPIFNVTHFMDSGLLWMQVRAKGPNGYSNTVHIEINFNEEEPKTDLREEVSLSLLPILCLLAGSLAVLLSIIAGILECSRRKYTVSNEVTHISFSNNLDINPSGISSFKTESYEQLNDVKFEGFKLDNRPNTSGASTSEMGTLSENTERLREETNQLLR